MGTCYEIILKTGFNLPTPALLQACMPAHRVSTPSTAVGTCATEGTAGLLDPRPATRISNSGATGTMSISSCEQTILGAGCTAANDAVTPGIYGSLSFLLLTKLRFFLLHSNLIAAIIQMMPSA